jgi:anti-sigma factor ChrR (cupin superfamily)
MAYLPQDVSKADQVFGGKAMEILPPYSKIPKEFKDQGNPWVYWQNNWFFRGLQRYPVAKDGIDLKKAMANLACVQGSYAPKHEHKQAGVAYLASLWFSSEEGEWLVGYEPQEGL